MTPEKAVAQLAELAPYLTFYSEVQLADFGETAASGANIKFRIPDPLELEVFRGRNRVTKNKQGARYMLLLVELQDDDSLVDQDKAKRLEDAHLQKGGALSKNAGMLCRNPEFIDYLQNRVDHSRVWNELSAKNYIYTTCGITSRAQLDHSRGAAQKYQSFVLSPFNQYRAAY